VATAWNLGCEVANGEFIQILNDDMEVTERWVDSQKELYEYLTSIGKKVGSLASKLMRGNEVLSRGGAFRGTQLVPVPEPEEVKPVSYSNTPFFKRELFRKLGGFKAYAQMYYEDAGWGLQCMKAGYTNYYNPMSVIRHETLGFLPEHGEREFKQRQYNEQVVQKEARENFMKLWKDYLENEHENIY
jgi:GT2 family glycosyltransferase